MKWLTLLSLLPLFVFGQKQKYFPITVAFYNAENLYDTVDNTLTDDDDFLESGKRHYTKEIYSEKITHIAQVIADINKINFPNSLAILGLAEIENDTVLNDLIHHTLLEKIDFRFIHFDSKDRRGVDVALIYNPKLFKVLTAYPIFVAIPSQSKASHYTRDILYVEGMLLGEKVHIFVNHWPSRVGGETKSYPARAAVAQALRRTIKKIATKDSLSKIIVMGDLNDDPISKSVVKDLGTTRDISIADTLLYNPWVDYYQKGIGTLAYQNAWGLFDQIILSKNLLAPKDDSLFYWKSNVFRADYLLEKNGNYKGYPKRTFSGDNYQGGYSDHLPVYITLLRKL